MAKTASKEMSERIEHKGIVEQIDGQMVRVRILQTSACAACHAKSMCMAAESAEKIVDAEMACEMSVGDEVVVSVEKRMEFKAVLIAFVIPFFIMLALIALLGIWIAQEWLVALLSISALAVYCVVVRLLRKKIEGQFKFYATKG